MEASRKCTIFSSMRLLCIFSFWVVMITHCDARKSALLSELSNQNKNQNMKHFKILEMAKSLNMLIDVSVVKDSDSSNAESFVNSPLNLPPYDSLSPNALPDSNNSPPYCVYPPPNGPISPPSIMPSPTADNPTPISPPSSPIGLTPSPATPETSYSPPITNPGPPQNAPSPPDFEPSPPSGEVPSPTSADIPSPPTSADIPSPPSSSSGVPSPTSGDIPSPSSGSSGGTPSPTSGYIPSPPSVGIPSPSGENDPTPTSPSGENPSPTSPTGGEIPSPPESVPSPYGFEPSPPVFEPPDVYPPPITPPPRGGGGGHGSGNVWCVAKPSVPDPIIQEAMNYACGSGADCGPIQSNGPCFHPNTILAHASYAFNSYWQRTKVAWGTCSFGGTAILVTVNPSSGSCQYVSV